VHGANLGLTAAAYLDAGGRPALPTGEDQALVDTLRARSAQLPWARSASGCHSRQVASRDS
jgi:hypothetical protein